MEIIKNKEYVIEIYDIGEDGEGIGKIGDFVVFVDKALPGEKVLIKLIKAKKSYGYGKLLSILEKSPFRTEPVCEVFKRCGGCSLQHLQYSEQLRFKTKKVKDSLERIGGLSGINVLDTIGMENPYNYRNKAQFPVGVSKNGLSFGFYAPRSHNIINISKCFIQNQINEKIISAVREFMLKYNIPPYDEQLHKGVIRHVVTRTAVFTNEIMVCVVIKGKLLPKSDFLVEELLKIKGVTSILLSHNDAKTNVIMGSKIDTLYGKSFIEDYIGEFKFEISPLSFFQVNPIQTQILYRTALDFAELTGTETVIDAYCGIGTISLFVSRKAKRVIGVEAVSEAVSDARRNAFINGVTNVEFIAGKAEEVIPDLWESKGVKPDVIFLDPPRKGCDARLIDMLLKSSTPKIVYVSCNPSTLARDLRLLSDKYLVGMVQPVDMFCMTAHVETVVLLSKLKTKKHIDIELHTDELDLTSSESKATYQEIKEYVKDKFDLKVSTLNIAQTKTKCGIIERECYRKPKNENAKQPKCTLEKENAIKDAFRHFQMI